MDLNMSLELDWKEEVDDNALDGFDFDEWIKNDNGDIDTKHNTNNIKQLHSDILPPSIATNKENIPKQIKQCVHKCPFCNEICDTFKALEVHCNLCCSNTETIKTYKCQTCNKTFDSETPCNKHSTICIQQKKAKERQQKQWQNILNMNKNNKKRSRNNSDDDAINISYHMIPSKKRKTNISPKISKMSKKNKNSNKKKAQIQTTIEDVIFVETPGFDIDLFPNEKDCIQTDEKSSQLHIKQTLKENNINNKAMKDSFLNLNGLKTIKERKESVVISDSYNSDIDNEQLSNSFNSCNYNASPDGDISNDKNKNTFKDDPLSPIMMSIDETQGIKEHLVLSNVVKSSKKKKHKNVSKKKEIKFIPPWEMI